MSLTFSLPTSVTAGRCGLTRSELDSHHWVTAQGDCEAKCPDGTICSEPYSKHASAPAITASSRVNPSELLAMSCPSSSLVSINQKDSSSGQLIRLCARNYNTRDGSAPTQADDCLMLLDQGSELDLFLPAYEAWKLKLKPDPALQPHHVGTVTGLVLVIFFEQILITLQLRDKDGGNVERSIKVTPATPLVPYSEFKAAEASVAHSTEPQSISSSPSFLTPVKVTPTLDTSGESVSYPLTSISPLKHEKDGNEDHFVILGLPAIERLNLVMDVTAKKVYMAKKRMLHLYYTRS